MNCYICKSNKNEKSKEHIIPNALGGRKVTYKALCIEHNSKFGEKLDKDFIEIFSPIAKRFDLKTHRSINTKVKGKNSEHNIKIIFDNNRCYPVTPYYDSQANILYCINQKVADNYLKKVKNDGNYNDDLKICFDLSGIMKFDFTLDNLIFKKGLTKIALNFCAENDIPIKIYEHLIDEKNLTISNNCQVLPWIPSHPLDFLIDDQTLKKSNECYHMICLQNDNETNALYCYVELFSIFKFIVLISEDYKIDNPVYYIYNLNKAKKLSIDEYLDQFSKINSFIKAQNYKNIFKKISIRELNNDVKKDFNVFQLYGHMHFDRVNSLILKMLQDRKLYLINELISNELK